MKFVLLFLLLPFLSLGQSQAIDSLPLHLREVPRHQLIVNLGIAQPLGDFSSVAGSGIGLGLDYEYYVSKNWGLSVGARHTTNQSVFTRVDDSSYNNERVTSLTIGPVVSLRWNRFQIDALARGGIGFLDLNKYIGDIFMLETLVLTKDINTAAVGNAALRFNYYFRRHTQLFFSAHYQTTLGKPVDYSADANFEFGKLSIIGPIAPRFNQSINVSNLTLAVGVKFALGRKYTSGELRDDSLRDN